MFNLGLDHIAHAAATAGCSSCAGKAKAAVPTLLTIAGFTPLQVEVMITSIALLAQALIFAALRVKTALPNRIFSAIRLLVR